MRSKKGRPPTSEIRLLPGLELKLVPGSSCLPLSSPGITSTCLPWCSPHPAPSCGIWRVKLRVLGLQVKCSINLSHPPRSPIKYFFYFVFYISKSIRSNRQSQKIISICFDSKWLFLSRALSQGFDRALLIQKQPWKFTFASAPVDTLYFTWKNDSPSVSTLAVAEMKLSKEGPVVIRIGSIARPHL